MKIKFYSLANPKTFEDIEFIDIDTYFLEYGLYAVDSVRKKELGNRRIIFTSLNNIFAIPEKQTLQIERPNEDGVTHYGALFKAKEWQIGSDLLTHLCHPLMLELFEIRGVIGMEMIDEAGITSIAQTTVLSVENGTMTLINPEVFWSKSQSTFNEGYIYSSSYNKTFFPSDNLWAGDDTYSGEYTTTLDTNQNLEFPFYVSVDTDFLIEYEVETEVSVKITGIITNGVDWNCPDQTLLNGEKIVFANNQVSDYPYSTPGALKIYKRTTTNTMTQIGTFSSGLIGNNNGVKLELDFTSKPVGQDLECRIKQNIYSKGNGLYAG